MQMYVNKLMLKDMMLSNFKPAISNKSPNPFLRAALIGNNDLSKHLKSKVTLVFKIEDTDCAKGFLLNDFSVNNLLLINILCETIGEHICENPHTQCV